MKESKRKMKNKVCSTGDGEFYDMMRKIEKDVLSKYDDGRELLKELEKEDKKKAEQDDKEND